MFSITGIITWFVTSKLGRYAAFALSMALVVIAGLTALRSRDKRMIAADRIKAELNRQRKLNEIRKRQIEAANNRVTGDDLIDSLRDDKKDF